MAAAVSSNIIEDHIRTTASTKRIRPSEFFQDYDKLRSGYVTGLYLRVHFILAMFVKARITSSSSCIWLKLIIMFLPLPETQFFRVLWENLGVKLSEEQQNALAVKYDFKGNGQVNYRKFCDVINRPFNPNDLTIHPAKQNIQPVELWVWYKWFLFTKSFSNLVCYKFMIRLRY